jgi:hypothetical protein
MQELEARQGNPELRELVVETSRALARLYAGRLEELALSCQALNQGLASLNADGRADLARQAGEATADMAVFSRVLDATRANRNAMNRLRELRAGRLECSERRHKHPAGGGRHGGVEHGAELRFAAARNHRQLDDAAQRGVARGDQ